MKRTFLVFLTLVLSALVPALPAHACDKSIPGPDGWALVQVMRAVTSQDSTIYSCRVLTGMPALPSEQDFHTLGGAFTANGQPKLRLQEETRPDGVVLRTIGLIEGECVLVTYYNQGTGGPRLYQRFSACLPGLEQPSSNTQSAADDLAESLQAGFAARANRADFDDVLLVDSGPQVELITDAFNSDTSRPPFSRVVTRLYAGDRISFRTWRAGH